MASQTRPVRFPKQLVIMVADTMAERIEREANERQVPKSQVAREYIDVGIDEVDAATSVDEACS